jgi:hypothetical protein
MNSNVKGIISVIVVGGLLYIAYKKFVKPNNRKVLINYLDATFGASSSHADFINNADKGYVDNWAKALMKGESTFVYNNKTYMVSGGTAKK